MKMAYLCACIKFLFISHSKDTFRRICESIIANKKLIEVNTRMVAFVKENSSRLPDFGTFSKSFNIGLPSPMNQHSYHKIMPGHKISNVTNDGWL